MYVLGWVVSGTRFVPELMGLEFSVLMDPAEIISRLGIPDTQAGIKMSG